MKKHIPFTTLILLLLVSTSLSAITLSSAEVLSLYNKNFNATAYNYVSVHDPSVVEGYKTGTTISGEYSAEATKVYYIFGSHLAWAYSYDKKNWTSFTNNINSSYATLFANPIKWSAKGSSTYNVSGNMWAPDVIWNKKLQKWCMYMSINGDNWYSSIVMLTATTLNGSWTYEGPVVYSGFTNQTQAEETDFYKVISTSEGFPSRYLLNRNGMHTYGLNAIDPCVFYDKDGNLWMSYGSWFGGLYILKLDGDTGLRDYTYSYTTTNGTSEGATSDAYQGLKIGGGNGVSGEGSYIQYINGTYNLFVSNGGLTSTGGYNMRIFKSPNVTGPYTDMTGQDARYSTSNTSVGQINGSVGLRLMSNYKWSWMKTGNVAQGHNSALVDDDGRSYVVYHTRFDNGSEGHQVRVHQLFQTKAGHLTAAPFQYAGDTLASTPYPVSEIVGRYGILYHGLGTDYANLVCVEEKEIVLNEDGTVSGAYTGTWSQATDGPYLAIKVNNVSFYGVLLNQKLEGLDYSSLCFSAVGSDMSLWGYKMAGEGMPFAADATVAYNAKNLNGTIPSKAYSGTKLSLPTQGHFGATYSWSWDTTKISEDGTIKDLTANTSSYLVLTIHCGDYNYTAAYPIQLLANNISDLIPLDEAAIMESYADTSSYNKATPSTMINFKTGLSLSFYIENITSDWDLIAHSSDNIYNLFLSVLRFNSVDFYESKATLSSSAIAAGYNSSTAWRIFLNTSCYVTVSFNTNGSISYYKDGVLMLTFAAATTPSYGTGVTPSNIVTSVINYYRNGKLIFDRDIKNIVVGYATDLNLSTYEPLDISEYAFYEDYDNVGVASSWTSPSGAILSLYDTGLKSNYIQATTNGGSGNRSAYNLFSGVNNLTKYKFSVDACLTSGNVTDRSVGEVALISTDNSNYTNYTTSAGYIFRLTTPTYNGSNGSIWYVNGVSTNALVIAPGTWVTISGEVDIAQKTVVTTILNRSTGGTIYSGTTTVNGNGILKGMWIVAGRGTGTIGVDNIKIMNNDFTGLFEVHPDIDRDADAEIYNLSGVKTAQGKLSEISLPTGVYIIRQGNIVNKALIVLK